MIKPSRGNASLASQEAQGCQENLTILNVELYVSRPLKIEENTQNLHARASSSWIRQVKTNRFRKRSRRRENAPGCYTSLRWNPPLQFGQISRRAHSACGPVPQGSSHLQVEWTQRCQRIRCCRNRWGRELKSLYYIVKMSHGKFLLEQYKYFILSSFMRNVLFPGQEMHKPWNTSPFKYFSSAAFKKLFLIYFFIPLSYIISNRSFPEDLVGRNKLPHHTGPVPGFSFLLPPLLLVFPHACLPTHATQVTSGMSVPLALSCDLRCTNSYSRSNSC